jgi:hypothetical protein
MPRRRRPRLLAAGALVALIATAGACSDEPERSVAAYCAQVTSLTSLDADLASGDPTRIGARAEDLRLLRQVAPAEIEPSLAVLAGITDDFARTAGTATDPADVPDEVFRGRSEDIAGIEAASTQVADYTAANCQIDLDGRGSSVPGSATPSAPPAAGTDASTTSSTSTTAPPTTAGGAPTSTTTTAPSLLVD